MLSGFRNFRKFFLSLLVVTLIFLFIIVIIGSFSYFFYVWNFKKSESVSSGGKNGGQSNVNGASVPITVPDQLNQFKVYRSDKLGVEIGYPAGWVVLERFDFDAYEARKNSIGNPIKNPVKFNHDFYSSVSFYPMESSFGINSLELIFYPNSKKLSLYDYFKGRTQFLIDPRDYPHDTYMSELIEKSEETLFGDYKAKVVRDMPYSDVGNQIYRKIYITFEDRIYVISLGYLYGDDYFHGSGFKLPNPPIPIGDGTFIYPAPLIFEDFVKLVGDSFIIY